MGKKISLYFVLVRGLQEYFLFFLSSKAKYVWTVIQSHGSNKNVHHWEHIIPFLHCKVLIIHGELLD
jgi:hypothetical protein